MGLMDGKRGVIFGVANDKSIAWGIAQQLHEAGAEIAPHRDANYSLAHSHRVHLPIVTNGKVLFTVGNTMTMAVVERTTEIGTLRAIGLRRSGIRRLFVSEGLLLGMIGAVIGVVGALVAAWLVNHSGLTWTPPGQASRLPLTVRVWGELKLIGGTAVLLVAVAMVSAWWPSRRAARMNIVESLRHV